MTSNNKLSFPRHLPVSDLYSLSDSLTISSLISRSGALFCLFTFNSRNLFLYFQVGILFFLDIYKINDTIGQKSGLFLINNQNLFQGTKTLKYFLPIFIFLIIFFRMNYSVGYRLSSYALVFFCSPALFHKKTLPFWRHGL